MAPSLEELTSVFAELGAINYKQEKKVRYLESTTINLVTAYIFIQGLNFFCVSQHPNNISCTHSWIPFCLTSLTGVIFAVTFPRFVGKWERTQCHLDMNFMERDSIYHRIVVLKESQARGCPGLLNEFEKEPQILKCDVFQVYQRKAFICIVSLALVAYTLLILRAYPSIPCHTA